MRNRIIIPIIASIPISIIFSLVCITGIETTYAYHNKFHLNNSSTEVTISSTDDIPDWLLNDIKKGIERDLKAEEKKANENNNVSQLQINTNTGNTKGNIILSSHKYEKGDSGEFDDLIGQIKNIGNGTAENVHIIFTYYDNDGNVVDTSNLEINAEKLKPGQKAPFRDFFDSESHPDMKYYEITLSWYNEDGTQEYIENVEVAKKKESSPISENDKSRISPFVNTLDENGKNADDDNENGDEEDEEN